ncbi:putative ferric-chelate reductase 1 [Conger conger]|uniref:putative ferric-chelate reductase 1 n=1 Tax=Conger conger TaxID=82655 RepID=UPI002A5A9324|nr:putative ferric-chelate reductase 1 [Conger conger]XP_061096519.1 putative ferric-chelate reductase 1 [Conger conger]
MYPLLFIILAGPNSVHVVTSYSNGKVESACESMTPDHSSFKPQNTATPYIISTANINPPSLDEIIVILSATSIPFRGFLLEAEDSQGRRPVGTFTLIDSSRTQLLSCSGNTASAVSHTKNDDKNEIRVKWKRPEDGNYTFRAAFVQRFNMFWVDELRDPIATTSQTTITTTAASTMASTATSKPPATTSTTSVIKTSASTTTESTITSKPPATTSTTSVIKTTASTTTDSTITSKPPATTLTTSVHNPSESTMNVSTVSSKPPATTFTTSMNTSASTMTGSIVTSNPSATTPASSVCNTSASTLSASTFSTTTEIVNVATPLIYGSLAKNADSSHSGLWFKVHVLLMSLFSIGNIIAFIFVFVEGWRTEAHPVLVCVVTALTFVQIVVTFFRCGQSHELRFIFNWFHRLNAFAIVCLTVAAVFTGLASIEVCSTHLLQKLMGGLVAWGLLFYILQLSLSWSRTTENDCSGKTTNVLTVLQIAMLVVFSLGNAALLVALLINIFAS